MPGSIDHHLRAALRRRTEGRHLPGRPEHQRLHAASHRQAVGGAAVRAGQGHGGHPRPLAPAPPHRQRSLDRAPAPGGAAIRRAPRRLPGLAHLLPGAAQRARAVGALPHRQRRHHLPDARPGRLRLPGGGRQRDLRRRRARQPRRRAALPQRLSRQARQGDLPHQRPPVPRVRLHAGADGVDDLDRQGAGALVPQPAAGLSAERRRLRAAVVEPARRRARVHRISRSLSRDRAEMGSRAVRLQVFRQQDPRADGLPRRHRHGQAGPSGRSGQSQRYGEFVIRQ